MFECGVREWFLGAERLSFWQVGLLFRFFASLGEA
jgi:hypothetical protein